MIFNGLTSLNGACQMYRQKAIALEGRQDTCKHNKLLSWTKMKGKSQRPLPQGI